jgi:hypothetical protein
MSSTKVKIADIVVPEIFDPYFLERTAEKSNLVRAGIVVQDPTFDTLATKGGQLITMPFYTDLTGDDQVLSDTTPLTTGKIGTSTDVARLITRGDARSVNDLSGALSGTDPLRVIGDLISDFWLRKEQTALINTLTGLFLNNADTTDAYHTASDLILTHAAEATADVKPWNDAAPTVMCPEAIIDGQALMGDSQDNFTAIVMHSKCLTDLIKQELIDTERPSGANSKLYYYLDKEVIIDDNCPTRVGTGTGTPTVYKSFLFGKGAIARGEGRAPVPSELQREGLASDTYLITRRHYLLHPRGFRWMEDTVSDTATVGGPSNANLALAANWRRVYEKKNTRIVMIETN